jgi:hypothetical protein
MHGHLQARIMKVSLPDDGRPVTERTFLGGQEITEPFELWS